MVDETYTNPDGFFVCAKKNVEFRFYTDETTTDSGYKFDLNYQNLNSSWCQNSAVGFVSSHGIEDDIVQDNYPVMDPETDSFESPNPYENSQDITMRIGVPVGKQLVVRVDYFMVEPYYDGVELVVDETDVYYFTGIHNVSSSTVFRIKKSVLADGYDKKGKRRKNHRQPEFAKDKNTGSEISETDNDDTEIINDQYGGHDFDNPDTRNEGDNDENSSRESFYSYVVGDDDSGGSIVDETYTNPDRFVVCAKKNVKFRFYTDGSDTDSGYKFDLKYQNLNSDGGQN